MSFDFTRARDNMVENDVRTSDVTDRRLIAAMRALPREQFVPEAQSEIAYGGLSVPVGTGRFLMDARNFAKLVQAADIASTDKVLDIGCATGYSAAVLSHLAQEIVAVEEDESLAHTAEANLTAHGGGKVALRQGKLTAGSASQGPYDVILIEGMVEMVPEALGDQLKDEGRLLAFVATAGHLGRAMLFIRSGGVLSGRALFDASVPRLPGFEKKRAFVL